MFSMLVLGPDGRVLLLLLLLLAVMYRTRRRFVSSVLCMFSMLALGAASLLT